MMAQGVDCALHPASSGGISRIVPAANKSRKPRQRACGFRRRRRVPTSHPTSTAGTRKAENRPRGREPRSGVAWAIEVAGWCSGSTGRSAVMEGMRFTGIELNPEYASIAEARIRACQPGLTLGVAS